MKKVQNSSTYLILSDFILQRTRHTHTCPSFIPLYQTSTAHSNAFGAIISLQVPDFHSYTHTTKRCAMHCAFSSSVTLERARAVSIGMPHIAQIEQKNTHTAAHVFECYDSSFIHWLQLYVALSSEHKLNRSCLD